MNMIDRIRTMTIEELAKFLIIKGVEEDEDESYDGSLEVYTTTCYYTPFGVYSGWMHMEDVMEDVIDILMAEERPHENG